MLSSFLTIYRYFSEMAGYPLFTHATVLSADAGRHALHVVLASGQVPAAGIRVITHGPADAVTVTHKPLPRPGTRGLVCFVGGDPRNGIWLGSYYGTGNDALTSDSDPNIEMSSHWSGNYEITDGAGNYTHSFNDGTYIQSAATTTKPQLSRHVINADQSRSLVAFPDSARIPHPPGARPFIIHHASGTTIVIDAAGNVTITAGALSPSTVVVHASGTITATDPSGTVLALTNDGNVTITGNLIVHGNVTTTGSTVSMSATGSLAVHAPSIQMGP